MTRNPSGCRLQFAQAKRALAKGRLNDALSLFQESLEACPVKETAHLHRICYYLGVTFIRLGMASCAVRSWDAGISVRKRGYAHNFKIRFMNEYGMPRIGARQDDDWQVFYTVHVKRYLSGKKTEKLGSVAEKDMITDLIRDAWKSLISSVRLQTMSPKQRLELFRSVEIIFPFFEVPAGAAMQSSASKSLLNEDQDGAVEYDFSTRQRLSPASCPNTIPFRTDG